MAACLASRAQDPTPGLAPDASAFDEHLAKLQPVDLIEPNR